MTENISLSAFNKAYPNSLLLADMEPFAASYKEKRHPISEVAFGFHSAHPCCASWRWAGLPLRSIDHPGA
jgi:hypothetical protein